MTVGCFDPPFPSLVFKQTKSPRLYDLNISTEQFRARLIDNPEEMVNHDIHLSAQQLLDIESIWEEE